MDNLQRQSKLSTVLQTSVLFGLAMSQLFCIDAFGIASGTRVTDKDLLATSSVVLHFKTVKGLNQFCSSVVISQDVLLTAAHCVNEDMPNVLLGTRVQSKGDTEVFAPAVEVEKVYVNESYDKTTGQDKHREDIAIVHLKKPLPLQYHPAEMELDAKRVDGEIRISGFGAQTLSGKKHNFGSGTAAAENVELREKNAKIVAYDATVFKIGQSDGGLCFGDSGGGAYDLKSIEEQKLVVRAINITAGSEGGAPCGSDAFALRLSSKKDWINETLEKIKMRSPSEQTASVTTAIAK